MATDDPHRRRQASPAVWTAAEVGDEAAWTVVLDDAQRVELAEAARAAAAAGRTPADLTAEAFPLPGLAPAIDDWVQELAGGRGFLRLRGFPVEGLTEAEVELAYLGLGTHLGTPVGQNKHGDVLTHIRDERLPDTAGVRLYRTKILDRRPDLLDVLHEAFPWDRQGEHGPDDPPWFALAPFADVGGEARVFYIGWYIRDSQQHADAPRLTGPQQEAMALIEEIANDPAFHVARDFRPGDVQLLNNARILHSREAYEDAEDPAERRHLLRLWLAAHRFTAVDDLLRAGIPAS